MATSRVSTPGWVEACTISQPAVAVSATPEAEASAPSDRAQAERRGPRGRRGRRFEVGGPVGGCRCPGEGRRRVRAARRAGAVGGGQRRDVVGERDQGRPVGHDHDRAVVRPSSTRVSAMTCSVSSSRWAVGSSSSTHGRSASTTRARASRARSPAESVAPSSPTGASRPPGRSRTRSSSATRRSAAHSGVVVGVGAAEAEVVGDACRRRTPGAAGSQATWLPPGGAADRVGPPRRPTRRSARAGRRARASSVDLPQPDGPRHAR